MAGGIFLDVLPRFDLAAAESLLQKLTEGWRKAGADIGTVYGNEATNALRKIQDEVKNTSNVLARATDDERDRRTAVDLLIKKQADSEAARGAAAEKVARDIELQEQRVQAAKERTRQIEEDIAGVEEVSAGKQAEYNRARIAQISAENALLDKQAQQEKINADAATAADADRAKRAAAQRDLATATATTAAAQDDATAAAGRHDAAIEASGVTAGTASKAFGILGVAAGGAFAAIGTEGVKHAADWEASAAKMTAATNMTAGQIADLQQKLQILGPQVGENAQTLQNAAYMVAKAGFNDAASQVDILRVAAELGKVEGIGLEESVSGLTNTLNDFHVPASKAADIAAQFQTAFRDAKAPVDQLMGSLHNFEPIMKLIADHGGDPSKFTAQTGAMLAQTVQPGTSPDQASEQIRNTLLHLIQANGPQADMLNQILAPMGLTQQSLSNSLSNPDIGPVGVMATMQQALQKATDPKTGLVHLDPKNVSLQAKQALKEAYDALSNDPVAQKLASDIMSGNFTPGERKEYGAATKNNPILAQFDAAFNREAGLSQALKSGRSLDQTPEEVMKAITGSDQGLLTMSAIAGDPETLKKTLGIADRSANAKSPNGQDIQDWSNVTQTFQFHVDQLKSSLNALWTEIGTNVLPVFKGVVNVLKDVVEWMGRNKEAVTGIVDALGAAGAAWALWKTAMLGWNAISTVFDGITAGITKVVESSSGLKLATLADETVIEGALQAQVSKYAQLSSAATEASAAIAEGNATAAESYAEVLAGAQGATDAIAAQGPAADAAAAQVSAAAQVEVGAEAAVLGGAETASIGVAGIGKAALGAAGPLTALGIVANQILDKANGQWGKKTADQIDKPGASWWDQAKNTVLTWMGDDPTKVNPGGTQPDLAPPTDPNGTTKSPESLSADTLAKIHDMPDDPVGDMQKMIAGIPKIDPKSMLTPSGDGNDAAGDSGSGSGQDKVTTPNIDTNLPFHPIDLNYADKPLNETYDAWISHQKAIQTAMGEVDQATLNEAKARAALKDKLDKGGASQEEINTLNEDIAKAYKDHLEATQNLTIAQTKNTEAANKEPRSGRRDGEGLTGTSILEKGPDFSPKGIGQFFTALLVDLAVGNPIGKELARERGADPSNPLYVSDVGSPQSAIASLVPGAIDANNASAVTRLPGYAGDAALLANVPAGKYSQDPGRDLLKGLSDCSSSVGDLVNVIDGQKSGTGGNLTTGDAASWLPAHGFLPNPTGANVPGAFNVGYNSEHMQATLPQGTNWNWGSDAAAAKRGMDGGGAFDPTGGGTGPFTQHWYRPETAAPAPGADWDAMAQKESGGNWADNTGNGYQGGLQFSPSTWNANGGQQYAVSANLATPDQQKAVAEQVLQTQGPSAWPNTFTPLPSGGGGGGGRFSTGLPFKRGPAIDPGSFGSSPRQPGTDLFAPGGALSAMPGAPGFTPAIPGAPGGPLGPESPGSLPMGGGHPAAVGGLGSSALLGAGPSTGGAPAAPAAPSQPTIGNSANKENHFQGGTGSGASASIGSTAASIAGPALDAIAPGASVVAQKGGQLLDRAIGFAGQVGGILAMAPLETFGLNDSKTGDLSKSWFGKLAGGLAGAHKDNPNTAGQTAAPVAPPAPPLKPGDGTPASGNGSGPPPGPMVNIEHQENHNGGGQEAANQTARTFMQFGGR